ncbi:hypothetical protein [Bradyrhizobium mercantei]|uniref:hypothetical protein n=1 Tax=Bradyrhizobium mercantei TaxID=1904807 RepID=UPI00373FCE08
MEASNTLGRRVADADLVVEAVPEYLEPKQQILADIGARGAGRPDPLPLAAEPRGPVAELALRPPRAAMA